MTQRETVIEIEKQDEEVEIYYIEMNLKNNNLNKLL